MSFGKEISQQVPPIVSLDSNEITNFVYEIEGIGGSN